MKKNTGFSMIELMIIIGIAAVLMSIAIPGFKTAMRNNCMTTSVNLLVTAVQFARSEAVKRRQDVRLTAGEPGTPADEWSGGWYVWHDTNGNGAWDANEELRVFTPACEPVIRETEADRREFIYTPGGFASESGGINVCMDNTGERGRRLLIPITGRPFVVGEADRPIAADQPFICAATP